MLGEGNNSRLFYDVLSMNSRSELKACSLKCKVPECFKFSKKSPNLAYYYMDLLITFGLGVSESPISLDGYYLNELGEKFGKELIEIVFDENKRSKKGLQKALIKLYELFVQNRPLFFALQEIILRLFNYFDFQEVINVFGFDILYFFNDQIVLSKFSGESIIKYGFSKFFQLPAVFANSLISDTYQAFLTISEPYPVLSKLIPGCKIITLVNTCVNRKQHFFDHVFSMARTFFCSKSYDHFLSITEGIEPIRNIVFLVFQDDLILPSDPINGIIHDIPDENGIVERYLNESDLRIQISMILGESINTLMLKHNSLPWILKPVINSISMDLVWNLQSKKYVSLSDDDSHIDFSFIFYFNALYHQLSGSFDSAFFTELVQQVDPEMQESLVIDSFSLLFLSEKHYSTEYAIQLLSILLPFSTNSINFLNNAISRIHFFPNAITIKDCQDSISNVVISSLIKKDYDIAIDLSRGNPKLNRLCTIAKNLANLNSKSISLVHDIPTRIEYFVSKGGNKSIVHGIDFCNRITQLLIEKRLKVGARPLNIFENNSQTNQKIICINDIIINKNNDIRITWKSRFVNSFVQYTQRHREIFGDTPPSFSTINQYINNSNNLDDIIVLLGESYLERYVVKSLNVAKKISLLVFDSLVLSEKEPDYQGENIILCRYSRRKHSVNEISNSKIPSNIDREGVYKFLDYLDNSYYMDIPSLEINSLLNEIIINKITDIELLFELKLHFSSEFDLYQDQIRSMLHFEGFYDLYPDKRTNVINTIIGLGITKNDPSDIIRHVLSLKDFDLAYRYSMELKMPELLFDCTNQLIIPYLNNKLDFIPLFNDWTKYSSQIFSNLPEKYQTVPNQILFIQAKEGLKLSYDYDDSQYDSNSYINLLTKYPSLCIDEPLMKGFREKISAKINSERLKQIITFAQNELRFFKNPCLAIDYFVQEVFDIVHNSKVTAGIFEHRTVSRLKYACQCLRKIKQCLSIYFAKEFSYELQLAQLEALRVFSSCYFCLRFGIKYSFIGFQTEECIKQLCIICTAYDEFQLLLRFISLWDISISSFLHSYSLLCYSIGRYDDGNKLIMFNNSSNSHGVHMIEEFSVFSVFIHPNLYLIDNNHEFAVSSTYPHLRARDITRGIGGQILSSNQIQSLDIFINKFYGPLELIRHKTTLCQIRVAINLFLQLDTLNQSEKNFWRYILFPTLAHGNWTNFWSIFSDIPQIQSQLKGVFQFLVNQSMFETVADIEQRLKLYSCSIRSYINLLKTQNSWEDKIKVMEKIIYILQIISDTKPQEKMIERELLNKYLTISGYQYLYLKMCIEKKIPFNPSLDLMISDKGLEVMAFQSLSNKKFLLGSYLMDLKPSCIPRVLETLILSLETQMIGISDYFNEIKEKTSKKHYVFLVVSICDIIVDGIQSIIEKIAFVKKSVPKRSLQIILLIRYRFFEEALRIANTYSGKKKKNMINLIESNIR